MVVHIEGTIIKAINHNIRRVVLKLLAGEPMSYTEILTHISISTGKLNYHLKILNGLISKTSDGMYSLSKLGTRALDLFSDPEKGIGHLSEQYNSPETRFSLSIAGEYIRKFVISAIFVISIAVVGFLNFVENFLNILLSINFWTNSALGWGIFLLIFVIFAAIAIYYFVRVCKWFGVLRWTMNEPIWSIISELYRWTLVAPCAGAIIIMLLTWIQGGVSYFIELLNWHTIYFYWWHGNWPFTIDQVIGYFILMAIVGILRYYAADCIKNWSTRYTTQTLSKSTRHITKTCQLLKSGGVVTCIPLINIAGNILSLVGLYRFGTWVTEEFSKQNQVE